MKKVLGVIVASSPPKQQKKWVQQDPLPFMPLKLAQLIQDAAKVLLSFQQPRLLGNVPNSTIKHHHGAVDSILPGPN